MSLVVQLCRNLPTFDVVKEEKLSIRGGVRVKESEDKAINIHENFNKERLVFL